MKGANLRRLVPAALFAIAIAAWALPEPSHAEEVIVVSLVFDRNDRIDAILAAVEPELSVQRIGLNRMVDPWFWGRATGETEPARLRDARLVVVESAHGNALADVPTDIGGNLLDALPRWVREGGQLLLVGGHPSYGSYPGTPLSEILPVVPAADPKSNTFKRLRRRKLSGDGDGRYVEHVHAVTHTRGEILMRAGLDPFAVRRRVGRGLVLAVLGGATEYFTPDTGPDGAEFFASPSWARFLVDFASAALGRALILGPMPDPSRFALPAARTGARIRSEYWFPEAKRGSLSLSTPEGRLVWTARPDDQGWLTLPDELRHGVYRARWEDGRRSRERDVRIGGAADRSEFDIRFFKQSHGPYPYGIAPGEGYPRARELADAGITSVVFGNHWAKRRQSQRDIRALREIIGAGLEIVYMHTLVFHHYGKNWPFEGRRPLRARDLEGKDAGWDVHDEAFRQGIDRLLDIVGEVRALPNIRALQPIEEYHDGGVTSPSLRAEMRARGLTGEEQPGDRGWFLHEEIRSRATGETFQRFRNAADRFLPGVPLATYWPGSYWKVPRVYTIRVPDLARAVDEFLGPGYGYQYRDFDAGWFSVVRSAAEIFAAHGHHLAEGRGTAIYTLGRVWSKKARPVGARSWRDTAWTALAHGATALAYFDLPRGEILKPLAALHGELFRIGPWIAAAPRRPAALAVLASWTTRNAGSEEETLRHRACIASLQAAAVESVEEIDYLLEEQVASPPAELRAIAVAAAPRLMDSTVSDLTRFAEAGGFLLLEPAAGSLTPEGTRREDPWARARATGRVHEVRFKPGCQLDARFWPAWLAKLSIAPESRTPEPRTEARLRGDDEILYWLLLNHDEQPASVKANARLEASRFTWRDLRSGAAVRFEPGSRTRLVRRVEPGDAAVLIGVRRPAASMELDASATANRVEIDVVLRDANGRPVADGYPVRIEALDVAGAPRLHAKARSRVTRDGRAHWSVPIPVSPAASTWTLRAEEPISSLRETTRVTIAETIAGDFPQAAGFAYHGSRAGGRTEVNP